MDDSLAKWEKIKLLKIYGLNSAQIYELILWHKVKDTYKLCLTIEALKTENDRLKEILRESV